MKNSKDKNIQQKLDKEFENADVRQKLGEDEDEKIYRLLYQELRKEPDCSLPPDFADSVVGRLQPHGLSGFLNPDHRPLLIGILGLLSLCFGMFWLFKLKLDLSALSMSSNMVITIILGIISLILIQIADQKLLKSKIFRALK